ncbi:hypothetical protein DUNSADRAFT_6772 [Dunaliella salina]|uniref:Encoded protein n=1 Tax=Dunaliella salina TaxID=3046 RepID=A0ABQ7H6P5_DUNSA|nr:hypothetical protein DUNSADRAFT_6772 [Dunaliella salina]|eukprot:KAF5842528.1 hypothetical protein DUNSADRAFT_6772 [Dunaliella salina]
MAQSNIHKFSKKKPRDEEQSLEQQHGSHKAHKAQDSTLLSLLASSGSAPALWGCPSGKPAKHSTASAGSSLTSFLIKQGQQQAPVASAGSRGQHKSKKVDHRTWAPKQAASSSSSRGLLVLGGGTHEEAAAAAASHAAGSRRAPRARQLYNFYEDGAGQWDDETIGIEGADTELKWEGIGSTML